MQSCNWVFTINNPTWEDDPLKWSGVKYLVFQKERGESGTDHFQGYVQFRCNKRLSALKALHKEAHWEVRQGTHTQARDYCMKEDTRIDGPWEHGVQPAPALKETLTLAMTDVKEGMTELELAEKYGAIWSRNYRALERYRTLCTNRHRSEKTFISNPSMVSQFSPGTGSTTLVSQKLIRVNFNKRVNLPIEFDSSVTTGAVSSIRSNNLQVIYLSDVQGGVALNDFVGACRIRFTDF